MRLEVVMNKTDEFKVALDEYVRLAVLCEEDIETKLCGDVRRIRRLHEARKAKEKVIELFNSKTFSL